MKIYFLSSTPCALFVNDAYFGTVNLFERFAEIDLRDHLFLRFIPEHACPRSFFLTEQIRFAPPEGCEVYLLPDGIAIYAKDFAPHPTPLRVIAQSRFEKTLVTVYEENGVTLALESPKGAFVATLPPAFRDCTLSYHDGFILLYGNGMLCVYTQTGNCVLQENASCFTIDEDILRVTIPLHDALGREAEYDYAFADERLEKRAVRFRQARTTTGATDEETVKAELLPLVFLESVLHGADYEKMLADGLAPDASKIKAYLGDFTAVVATDDPTKCGIVKPKAPRLFEVAYYRFSVEEGKIADIQALA